MITTISLVTPILSYSYKKKKTVFSLCDENSLGFTHFTTFTYTSQLSEIWEGLEQVIVLLFIAWLRSSVVLSWWRADLEDLIQFPHMSGFLAGVSGRLSSTGMVLQSTYKWHLQPGSLSVIRLTTWWLRAPRWKVFFKTRSRRCLCLRVWVQKLDQHDLPHVGKET